MTQAFWDSRQLPASFSQAQFDDEGFLRDLTQWSPALADAIGLCLSLCSAQGLSDEQQRIVMAARDFYQRYERMPTTRAFVKHLGLSLGEPYGQSATLMLHFPNYPMRLVALCAGLPKPPNCF
jgi:tRNA 2-thiouridine synthesizing protein E